MDAATFVKTARAAPDEKSRKQFIRQRLPDVDIDELEAEMVETIERWGWHPGTLMTAVRLLQIVPIESILHAVMRLLREPATYPRLHAQITAQLVALRMRDPRLEAAAQRFTAPKRAVVKVVTKTKPKAKRET
ncbi:MAG: hypothetical protein JNM17_35850 [Archangium sp.]|nr:hypothetical protein [Archangium sp.]